MRMRMGVVMGKGEGEGTGDDLSQALACGKNVQASFSVASRTNYLILSKEG